MRFDKKILGACILVVVCAAFFFLGILGICAHKNLAEGDTGGYIRNALEIRKLGPGGFLAACLTGDYQQASQQPLYLMALAPVAAPSLRAFVNAKVITFALSFIFVIVFYCSIYRLYGLPQAVLGTAFLIFSTQFIKLSTMVACETFLLLWIFLSWCWTVIGFKRQVWWLAAGAAGAAAYLTKATGLLVLPVFAVSVLVYYRGAFRQVLRNRYFWGFFLAFFLVSSPYMVRNLKVYHDPFYNSNRQFLWIDDWEEIHAPDFRSQAPSLRGYFARHPADEIAKAFISGIVVRGPRLVREIIQPFPFWRDTSSLYLQQGASFLLPAIYPLAVMAFFAVGFMRIPRREERIVTFLWLLAVYFVISWYSKMDPASRFMMPLAPFLFLYAGSGCVVFYSSFVSVSAQRWRFVARVSVWVVAWFFALWSGLSLVLHNDWKQMKVATSYSLPKNYDYLVSWTERTITHDERYFLGYYLSVPLFFVGKEYPGRAGEWPQAADLAALQDYIARNDVKYGVLNFASFFYRPQYFKGSIGFHPTQGMVQLKKINGFTVVAADPTLPRMFIVFRFDPRQFDKGDVK